MQFRKCGKLICTTMFFTVLLASGIKFYAQSGGRTSGPKPDDRAICHLTGSVSTPYELITVRPGAASDHISHGDVKPQNGACPSLLPSFWSDRSGKVQVKNQSGRRATSASALSSPDAQSSGKNIETKPVESEKKIAICHREGNGDYHLNSVAENSVAAHLAHGDVYPEGGACFSGGTGGGVEPGATPEPVTMLLFGVGLAGIGYATRRKLTKRSGDENQASA